MRRRRWTVEEMKRVAEWRRQAKTLAWIAAQLGRTRTAVGQFVMRRAVVPLRQKRWDPGDPRDEKLRQWNREGKTDREIAALLHCPRAKVEYARNRLGLPVACPKLSRQWFRRMRHGYRRWLEDCGCRSLMDYRHDLQALEAARMGWPQVQFVRQAQVLEQLWQSSNVLLSRRQIRRRVCPGGTDNPVPRGDWTYRALAALRKMGLVVIAGTAPARYGTRGPWLWKLAPGVEPRRREAL